MSSRAQTNKKTVIPLFIGVNFKYHIWHAKFVTRAYFEGYKKVLLGEVVVPKLSLPTRAAKIEPGSGEKGGSAPGELSADDLNIVKQNDEAYFDLFMAMDDKCSNAYSLLQLLQRVKSSDYPDGLASEALRSLMRSFSQALPMTSVF